MKKILFFAVFALICLGVTAVALPLLISSDAVRSSLLSRAKEITGREMHFSGDPTVSFYPFLGISIQDVVFESNTLAADAEPILSMPELKAKLSITSALSGKINIDEVQFIRPKFNLTVFKSGKTNWAFDEGQMWRALEQANEIRQATPTNDTPDIGALENVLLGRFIVQDGTIEHTNHVIGTTETITNFNATLSWPSVRSSWQFTGDGIWRGDNFKVTHSAKTPIMLLAGGQSALDAEITSNTLNISFEGEANRLSDFFLRGQIKASTASLRKLIEFFGGEAGVGSSFSNFSASGDISGTLKDVQLENATLDLDDNIYQGGLRISSIEGNNRISGTLAGKTVMLDPYLSGESGLQNIGSLYGILAQTSLDIRLSASSIKLDGIELTDFAGGLFSKDQQMKLDIGNGNLASGIVVGFVELKKQDDLISVTTSVDASGINPSEIEFLESFSGIRPSGRSNVSIKLNSQAEEFQELPNETSGSFSISMKQGQLLGLDFSDIRQSLIDDQSAIENIQIGNSSVQTQVQDLNLNIEINRGVGWIADSNFKIEEFETNLSGKADFRSGNLAVWGLLKLQEGENPLSPGGDQFFLGGTISQPLYVPNIKSQIPAPTPLIENAPTQQNTN